MDFRGFWLCFLGLPTGFLPYRPNFRVCVSGTMFVDGLTVLEDDVTPLRKDLEHISLVRRSSLQAKWLELVRNDWTGHKLMSAPAAIREDAEVVMAAMRRRPTALQHAAEVLKSDRDFMLAAVKEDRHALGYASRELLGDRDLVLQAVQHHGSALQFAKREVKRIPYYSPN